RYLPKGPLVLECTVRLNNPGTFALPQTRVDAMYAPAMFGEFPTAPAAVGPCGHEHRAFTGGHPGRYGGVHGRAGLAQVRPGESAIPFFRRRAAGPARRAGPATAGRHARPAGRLGALGAGFTCVPPSLAVLGRQALLRARRRGLVLGR